MRLDSAHCPLTVCGPSYFEWDSKVKAYRIENLFYGCFVQKQNLKCRKSRVKKWDFQFKTWHSSIPVHCNQHSERLGSVYVCIAAECTIHLVVIIVIINTATSCLISFTLKWMWTVELRLSITVTVTMLCLHILWLISSQNHMYWNQVMRYETDRFEPYTPLMFHPFTRAVFTKRGFCRLSHAIWNSFPRTVLQCPSLTVMKSRLMIHLFDLIHNTGL